MTYGSRRYGDGSLQEMANIEVAMTNTLPIILKALPVGCAVCLTDGRELVRFHGPEPVRALRYLRTELASSRSFAGI